MTAMYGRTTDGSIVFLGPVDGRPPGAAFAPPTYRLAAQPVRSQGITIVPSRSPSPTFRQPSPRAIPYSLSFNERPRTDTSLPSWGNGRSAVDPGARGRKPVACAAWAHNHPVQNGARPLHKMDSVVEAWSCDRKFLFLD